MENSISNRRHVLKAFEYGSILVLTLFWLSGCRGNAAGQEGGHNLRTIRFGLCANVHKDALYAIVTVRSNGTIEIDGIQSEWIRPSPSELGVPERKGSEKSTPGISSRILRVR